MKKIFRKILGTIILIGIGIFLLSACHVKSESQLVRYARQNFGECTLLSTETTKNNGLQCNFRDSEYGFEYYVKSEMHDINIDGSKFGSTESTDSNFSSQYFSLLQNTCQKQFRQIETEYSVSIEKGDIVDFMKINCSDTQSDFLKAAEKTADIIISFDGRKYYKDSFIGICDSKDNRLGAYYIHDKKWTDADDEYDFVYINEAKQLNRHAEFVRKEKKLFKETGLSPDRVKVSLGTDDYTYDTPVQYYYFTADGKEFFIADFMIDYDASLIRHYSNYDEIFN